VRPTALHSCRLRDLEPLGSRGRDVARAESVGGYDGLFHRMTRHEMLAYAERGEMPNVQNGRYTDRTKGAK